jgi:multiple sugar transport system ATP-binding protein
MSALSIEGVSKSFGSVAALANIWLDVAAGEFMVLLGPSGCGKSTLLNVIAGLENADNGRILIGGADVTRREPRARNIAMVFQSYALYPTMTVRGNMAFGLKMRGVGRTEGARQVEEAARILKIEDLLDRRPGELSGGQRQRVAIGRAIVRKPEIFLFDEPLSNLDAQLRAEMRHELKVLHQRLGATIIHVTHDQVEAMTLATRMAIMNHGAIEQVDEPQNVYDRPATIFVAGFSGAPPMNLIPGRLLRERVEVVFRPDGTQIDLAIIPPNTGWVGELGRKAVLGIRPEDVGDPATILSPQRVILKLAPVMIEPTGADVHVIFELGAARLIGRFKPGTIMAGAHSPIALDLARASLFDPQTGSRL